MWRRAAARRSSRSWLHREARAWLISVVFFLCSFRYDGALLSVPSLSGFSRGDLFWLLPFDLCVAALGVACGGGRGVWPRAAARRASRSWLHRVACAWLISVGYVLSFCACRVLVSFSARRVTMVPFLPVHL